MSKKKEAQAQADLAKAMNRLADNLERVLDPLWWQRTVGQTFQTMLEVPAIAAMAEPVMTGQAVPRTVRPAVILTLTPEERENMSQMVYEALVPQLHEFQGFVRQSLEDLPGHRLKELAAQIEGGETPKLEKRRGCIYVVFDNGCEQYLSL